MYEKFRTLKNYALLIQLCTFNRKIIYNLLVGNNAWSAAIAQIYETWKYISMHLEIQRSVKLLQVLVLRK